MDLVTQRQTQQTLTSDLVCVRKYWLRSIDELLVTSSGLIASELRISIQVQDNNANLSF